MCSTRSSVPSAATGGLASFFDGAVGADDSGEDAVLVRGDYTREKEQRTSLFGRQVIAAGRGRQGKYDSQRSQPLFRSLLGGHCGSLYHAAIFPSAGIGVV